MKSFEAQGDKNDLLIVEIGIKPKTGIVAMLAEKLFHIKNS